MIRGAVLLGLLAAGALWLEPERIILSGNDIQPAYTVAPSRPAYYAGMGSVCTTAMASGSGSMAVLTPCSTSTSIYTIGAGGGGSYR